MAHVKAGRVSGLGFRGYAEETFQENESYWYKPGTLLPPLWPTHPPLSPCLLLWGYLALSGA